MQQKHPVVHDEEEEEKKAIDQIPTLFMAAHSRWLWRSDRDRDGSDLCNAVVGSRDLTRA
jgi:hypothetical protein